jgi:hypothetical protein
VEGHITTDDIFLLMLIARGSFDPSFMPDEEDANCFFERNKKYRTFYETTIRLVKKGYINKDVTELTEKGTTFIGLLLDRATVIDKNVLDAKVAADQLHNLNGIVNSITKTPSLSMEEDPQ